MVSLTRLIPAYVFDLTHTFYVDTLASEPVIQNSYKLEKLRTKYQKIQELQKTSPNYGKYKGKNLIIVQAESLNTFPIGSKVDGEEVTPNMNDIVQ